MKLKIFQVDAFTAHLFSGNPAAVCPLDSWPDDSLLQNIAMENNLAETAFIVENGDRFDIRWFTPTVEVDLCGHATLASAHVIFSQLNHAGAEITFFSHRSGILKVARHGDWLTLDFPTDVYAPVEITGELVDAIGARPVEAYKGKTDHMLVYESEAEVRAIHPDFNKTATLPGRGVIVTSRGENVDFVSRFFGPQSGINEDPVTGSAHTTLTPYWSAKLKKTELEAIQASARQGYLKCSYKGDRVAISGQAKLYMTGELYLD